LADQIKCINSTNNKCSAYSTNMAALPSDDSANLFIVINYATYYRGISWSVKFCSKNWYC